KGTDFLNFTPKVVIFEVTYMYSAGRRTFHGTSFLVQCSCGSRDLFNFKIFPLMQMNGIPVLRFCNSLKIIIPFQIFSVKLVGGILRASDFRGKGVSPFRSNCTFPIRFLGFPHSSSLVLS
ncbi:unnamed protein product, partial [Allacma fusca]